MENLNKAVKEGRRKSLVGYIKESLEIIDEQLIEIRNTLKRFDDDGFAPLSEGEGGNDENNS